MSECIFCKIANHQEKAWLIHESSHSMAFLDIHPMNPFHTLIIPKSHHQDIFEAPVDVLQEMMGTLKYVTDLYRKKIEMTDVQIISSSGRLAQQDVFHLHFHIAPRLSGDGQDVKWRTSPELCREYDKMLELLGVGRRIGQE